MKTRKIVVIALACILTLMVGYALFSESITINGTASAKGEFDYSVECTPGLTSDVPDSYSDLFSGGSIGATAEGGYVNDTCSVSDKTVTFSTGLQYPTANRAFTIKVTNTGSIPMKLDVLKGATNVDYFINDMKADSKTLLEVSLQAIYEKGINLAIGGNFNNSYLSTGESAIWVIYAAWEKEDTTLNSGQIQRTEFTANIPYIQAD